MHPVQEHLNTGKKKNAYRYKGKKKNDRNTVK